jgi:hypothetical protein
MWPIYANLFAAGIKQVESRGRNTDFRGEFLIHATGTINRQEIEIYNSDEEFRLYVNSFLQIEDNKPLSLRDLRSRVVTGAIIGSANLTESLPSWDLKERWEFLRPVDWEREWVLGDHGSDRFAWLCKDHKQFKCATPCKGFQTILWSLPDTFVLNS